MGFMKVPGHKLLNPRRAEEDMAQRIDKISAFKDFQKEILPMLQADMRKGMKGEELYKKYVGLAAARGITIALTAKNQNIALKAIQDILDRVGGKPVQRTDNRHHFDDLSDAELDAMLITELKELNGKDEDK